MEYRFNTSDKREHQFPQLRIAHRLYKKLGPTIGSWLASPEWMFNRLGEVRRYNDWCNSQLPVLEDTFLMKRFTKVV